MVTLTRPTWKPAADSGVDEALLAEVQRHLGGASEVEAMNVALQEFVDQQRARRRQALQDLRRLSDEGAFNYEALDEVDK